jgi:20S proteasome alpha/beta subunit
MTDKTYTIADMISLAAAGDAADFQSVFNQLATERAAAEVEAARSAVAQSFINQAEDEEEEQSDA